jgi:hypothetical protein
MVPPLISLHYSKKKKIFSSSYSCEGDSSENIDLKSAITITKNLFEVSSIACKLDTAPEFSINIQGAFAKEIFFCAGHFLNQDNDPEPISIKLSTEYVGSIKRGEYRFSLLLKMNGETVSLYDGLATNKILEALNRDGFVLEECRFGLEWIVPHYFSWAGFAPSIDDYLYTTIIHKDDVYQLTLRFGGADIIDPDVSPIKAIDIWQKFSSALSQ